LKAIRRFVKIPENHVISIEVPADFKVMVPLKKGYFRRHICKINDDLACGRAHGPSPTKA